MPTYSKRDLPPCPGKPENYRLAKLSNKYYWRLKRGMRKPAVLNKSLQARADAMNALKGTIHELREAMGSFMQPLKPGRLHQRLFGLLQDSWVKEQRVNYHPLKGMELEPQWPLDRLFGASYATRQSDGVIQLKIPATKNAVVTRNRFATEFVLEALLISGRENLTTVSETSVLYEIAHGITEDCIFEFALQEDEPWVLLLKVACFEGKEFAVSLKHYGVKVVGVGYWEWTERMGKGE